VLEKISRKKVSRGRILPRLIIFHLLTGCFCHGVDPLIVCPYAIHIGTPRHGIRIVIGGFAVTVHGGIGIVLVLIFIGAVLVNAFDCSGGILEKHPDTIFGRILNAPTVFAQETLFTGGKCLIPFVCRGGFV
jgi:hypothetical protein